ncbi:hypothetical protein [Halobacteriovorax marinus]|uniref:hypothetical protein n=1 Tax=Halobacteriovorax marinus TaxID=97084 RepID=UPI003A95A753
MKAFFTTFLLLINSGVYADLVSEELSAKNGISCLKQQYGIFDSKNLENISNKVNCNQEVSVTNENKIVNLDCPSNPIFQNFLKNESSTYKKNNCLRVDRNKSPSIFENINCDCVTESLKNDYKDKYDQKRREFKDQLQAKLQDNIGKRLKKKIEYIKNSQILLARGHSNRGCFNSPMFAKHLRRMNESDNCRAGSEEAIKRMGAFFGDEFNIADTKNLPEAINSLIDGINNHSSLGKGMNYSANSCFADPAQMERKYINMKYDAKLVGLKSTFSDFIKNNNLNSPYLNQNFNNYVKEKGIDLHPHIRSLSKNHLRDLLIEIDNDKRDKELTLNDLFKGTNGRKWLKNLGIASRGECISIANQISDLICEDAALAYDDPTLVEEFLQNDEEYKNKNLLNLKSLYCENKDLHSVDPEGKLLIYQNKLNTNRAFIIGNFQTKQMTSMIKNIFNNKPEDALKDMQEAVDQGTAHIPRDSHGLNSQKMKRIDGIMNFMFVANSDLLRNENRSKRQGEEVDRERRRKSFSTFFEGIAKARRSLLDKQERDIRNIAKEVYDIKKPSQDLNQFTERFVNNYKDRRYTKKITDKLESFSPDRDDEIKSLECQRNFSNIYCSIKGNLGPQVKESCLDQIGSQSVVEMINGASPDHKFQNFCNAQSIIQKNTVAGLLTYIKDQISKKPDLCLEMTNNDYRDQYASLNRDSTIGSAYFESYTGEVTSLFDGFTDSKNFVEIDDVNDDSAISVDPSENANIVERAPASSPQEIPSSSGGLFSNFNFFKDNKNESKKDSSIKDDAIISEEDLKNKSNQELMDYISKLEDIIKNKENTVANIEAKDESSTSINPELEKLRKELEELKAKSSLVKKKLEENNQQIDTPKSIARPKISNTPFQGLGKPSASTSSERKSSAQQTEEVPRSESDISTPQQSTNTPSSSTGNSISLSLNEQFDEILSRPNSDGEVEIFFNDQKFTIEVKENDNGEMVCKFADEELNSENAEELDEICKKYVESLTRHNDAKKLTAEKKDKKREIATEAPKEQKRSQKFKVEDLNKVLNN